MYLQMPSQALQIRLSLNMLYGYSKDNDSDCAPIAELLSQYGTSS